MSFRGELSPFIASRGNTRLKNRDMRETGG